MKQVCKQDFNTLILNPDKPSENIEFIERYIDSGKYEYMSVDISALNIIDACTVATIGSTLHYIKYPEGKINWIVNSQKVNEYTDSMNLGNSYFSYKG